MPPAAHFVARQLRASGLLDGVIVQMPYRQRCQYLSRARARWKFNRRYANLPVVDANWGTPRWNLDTHSHPRSTTITVSDINTEDVASRLLENSPAQIALVIGGRILSQETIASFSGTWINVHGGILPYFRGLDSEYWALSTGRTDRIGVTIHELTAKVDMGDVFERSFVEPNLQESLDDLRLRNHANIASSSLRFVSRLQAEDFNIKALPKITVDWESARYFGPAPKGIDPRRPCLAFTHE